MILILFISIPGKTHGEENQYFWVMQIGPSRHTHDYLIDAKDGGVGLTLALSVNELLTDQLSLGLHFTISGWSYSGVKEYEGDLYSITNISIIPNIRYYLNKDQSKVRCFINAGGGLNFSGVRRYKYHESQDLPSYIPIFPKASKVLRGHFQPEIEFGPGLMFPIDSTTYLELLPMYHLIWIEGEKEFNNIHYWNFLIGLVLNFDVLTGE